MQGNYGTFNEKLLIIKQWISTKQCHNYISSSPSCFSLQTELASSTLKHNSRSLVTKQQRWQDATVTPIQCGTLKLRHWTISHMLISKASLKYKNQLCISNLIGNSAESNLPHVQLHHLTQLANTKLSTLMKYGKTSHADRQRNGKARSRAPMHQADIITFTFKANTEAFLHCVLSCYNRMFFPRTAIVTAQNVDLTFSATQWCKVRNLEQHWPAQCIIHLYHFFTQKHPGMTLTLTSSL